jgi:hypothetical protein
MLYLDFPEELTKLDPPVQLKQTEVKKATSLIATAGPAIQYSRTSYIQRREGAYLAMHQRFLAILFATMLLQPLGALSRNLQTRVEKSTDAVAFFHRAYNPQMNVVDIVNKFEGLLKNGQFEQASELLAKDFEFYTPYHQFDKALWFKEFPTKMYKERPDFGDFELCCNGQEVRRTGKKKIMMMNITMTETWTFTADGKILAIKAAKA